MPKLISDSHPVYECLIYQHGPLSFSNIHYWMSEAPHDGTRFWFFKLEKQIGRGK